MIFKVWMLWVLEDLESATVECSCAEAEVGAVSPTLSQSAQNNQGSESFCQTRQSQSNGLCTEGPQQDQIRDWQKCNQKPIVTRSKQAEQQAETAKPGKTRCVSVPSSVFVCFHLWCWRPCLCLCHSKCVSCVVLDKQAGTVFEKCVLLGTYHRGTRGKQSNQRGQNCLDIK